MSPSLKSIIILLPAAIVIGNTFILFAIAESDSRIYEYGHMVRNADARLVRLRQETFNSNDGDVA